MPLGGKYFPTLLKVMHHFRIQHLKPFFGKSMRLAGKEKKGREGKGRLTPIMERPGGYRRKKKLGGGGGNPKGGGKGRSSMRGLRLAWGLGRGGP